jgi:L-cysteate sulfo-lyase
MTEQCAVVSAAARPAPVVLGSWPTPLERAPRLAAAVGLAADALWVKRDDLSGLGSGGNKVRKLQYTCAQALAVGATTVITSGAPQSNHARLTAAAAARLGLQSVLVLQGEEPEVPVGNLVLDLLAGARLVWTGPATAEQARLEVERQAEEVRQDGGIPHVIPHGGPSSARAFPVDLHRAPVPCTALAPPATPPGRQTARHSAIRKLPRNIRP